MADRTIFSLFRPSNNIDLADAVISAAEKIGATALQKQAEEPFGLVKFGEQSGILSNARIGREGDHFFFKELSILLGGFWLEVRIQEGEFWDYTLYRSGDVLDNFSTWPQYWDEDDEVYPMITKGRPDVLAKAWNVPIELFDHYIKQWDMVADDTDVYRPSLRGKAYEADSYEYGNYRQVHDFIAKLGFTFETKWLFELRIPKRNYSPKREFIEDFSKK